MVFIEVAPWISFNLVNYIQNEKFEALSCIIIGADNLQDIVNSQVINIDVLPNVTDFNELLHFLIKRCVLEDLHGDHKVSEISLFGSLIFEHTKS